MTAPDARRRGAAGAQSAGRAGGQFASRAPDFSFFVMVDLILEVLDVRTCVDAINVMWSKPYTSYK